MRQRYNQYMRTIRPSEEYRDKLERSMIRELRKRQSRKFILPKTAAAVAAAAAALVLVFTGVRHILPARPDNVVFSNPGASASPTAAPTPQVTAPGVLEMLDETVYVTWSDANPMFGCHLLVNEAVGVFTENEAIKLTPGTAYWYLQTDQAAPDENMDYIQWWDEANEKLCEGWADPPFVTDEESPLVSLGIPGRVREGNTPMRIGPDFSAPENTWLEEDQYIHLFAQKNGWIFASTAPFDVSDGDTAFPLCGWVYAGDLVGLKYEGQEIEPETADPLSHPAEYPPEDEPWGLEMDKTGEGVWPTDYSVHITGHGYQSVLAFENYLVGGGTESDYVSIYDSPDRNGKLLTELQPGDAYWPVKGADMEIIYSESGNNAGYAQKVMYLAGDNTLAEGWKFKLYSDTPKEAKDNPVEHITRPGKVRHDNTAIRYGRSGDAPVVALLEEGQILGLEAQVGNWIYASTELFRKDGEQPVTGWIHVTEVIGLYWNVSIDHIDLTVDKANIRDLPDGEIINTVTKNDASSGALRYLGITAPGKEGDWHYVSLNGFGTKGEPVYGWIFADLAKLYTFNLSEKLPLENVVSATLAYAPTEQYPEAEARSQTVDGEKLQTLLARMSNALSIETHTPVCGDGVATITLKYADGSEAVTYLAADGCPQLRYGDVTYDLRTKEERAYDYMQEDSYDLREILGLFDEIAFL